MRVLYSTILLPALLTGLSTATLAQDLSKEKEAALGQATGLEELVSEMTYKLWDFSETALRETKSAAYLSDLLEEAGFTVTRGVADMPTAFVAEYGEGSPIIGILAEFDALPNIGNAPSPERVKREDGWPNGQGCGHNIFGAASVGGAISVKRAMEESGITGTVRLYGTPAEETVVGKVYMAKAGLFDDLDAAIEWHPGLETATKNQHSLAMNNFEVEFRGQAAHSAADPWNGRSALDAVELMNDAVNLKREHVNPTTRIHYVIPSAGEAPNVVPEYAKVWYYVRDKDRELVDKWYSHLMDIVKGVALATRTEANVNLITGVHSMLFNRPLQEAMQINLEAVGAPAFEESDQAWGRQMQAGLEIDETGFSTEIEPLDDGVKPVSGGSTDVAEVSRIVPTVGFSVASAPEGVPWHSWATSAAHGTPAARKSANIAAKVIALMGMDMLTNDELLAAAKSAFEEAMDGQEYVSPVPADQKPMLPEAEM